MAANILDIRNILSTRLLSNLLMTGENSATKRRNGSK